jgi:hypothetical protein
LAVLIKYSQGGPRLAKLLQLSSVDPTRIEAELG